MKSFKVIVLLLTFVGVFLIGIVIVGGILFFNAKTIVVPDDELTIQEAVDAANSGDIILVKESGGPYEENVTIDNTKNNIKLIGIEKTQPVIDGTNDSGNGITIDNTSGVLVKNFIVQNFDDNGIFLNGSNPNMIKGNTVNKNGNGIIVIGSNTLIKGNTANENSNVNNSGISLGNGIVVIGSNTLIKGNTANENNSVSNSGINLGNGIVVTGSNTLIKGNTANENSNGSNTGVNLGNGIVVTGSNTLIKDNTTNENSNVSNTGINVGNGIAVTGLNNFIKGNTANENNSVIVSNLNAGSGIFIDGSNNLIKSNTANENSGVDGGIVVGSNSGIFFNRAFGNTPLDINGTGTDNNFKGNKCDLSNPVGICN